MAFIQNFISRTFAEAVIAIKTKTGKEFKEIAESIKWDSSSLSQVVNSSRNAPPEIVKRFEVKYKVKLLIDPEEAVFKDLEGRLTSIEAHLEVYESAISGLLTKKKGGDFMETVALLRQKVSEAAKRRFEKLNGK